MFRDVLRMVKWFEYRLYGFSNLIAAIKLVDMSDHDG